MNYQKITDHNKNKSNPFIFDNKGVMTFEVNMGSKHIFAGAVDRLIVSKDGIIEGHSAFMRTKRVDRQSFIKIFVSEISSLFELSRKAIKVFGYIATSLKPNKDIVYFDYEDAHEYTGYKSRSVITAALSELIDYKFIARSNKSHWYFINPTIFFNGDRISFIKNYSIIKGEPTLQIEEK